MLDQEIDQQVLNDPSHPVTIAIVYLYSMETFLPQRLNRASRNKDINMIDTLGPFASVMNQIVVGTNH